MNARRGAWPALAMVAAAAARTSMLALARWPPGGRERWVRSNYRGAPVTLLHGPAFVLGAGALALPLAPARVRAAALIAVSGAAAVGRFDDLAGDGGAKGLRGHLGALRSGRVTSGVVKVLGLGLTGTVSAAVLAHGSAPTVARRAAGRPLSDRLDVLLGAAVVAGCANLVNLVDLRPGRALKFVLICAPLCRGPARPLAAVGAGAALALIGDDLAEHDMLGDMGANAAGALVGVGALAGTSRPARWVLVTVVTALTLASEVVSFTRVIEATPGLRALDRLGRRPARPLS